VQSVCDRRLQLMESDGNHEIRDTLLGVRVADTAGTRGGYLHTPRPRQT
jgi:hypothetical protein